MIVDENLVEITEAGHRVAIALAYAGPDNLLGRPVYGAGPCLLHRAAEARLVRAVELAALCGLKLRILDAYRPPWAHETFWRVLGDPRYVADPAVGSNHSRGVAVDLTLVDRRGRELDLGTPFDAMVEEAMPFHPGLSVPVQRRRMLLAGIMTQAGFELSDSEWWHFTLPAARSYPVLQDDRIQRPVQEQKVATPDPQEG